MQTKQESLSRIQTKSTSNPFYSSRTSSLPPPPQGFLNMTLDHPIRKAAVLIIKSRGFETFILLVILVRRELKGRRVCRVFVCVPVHRSRPYNPI